jgi:hypothetical protein
MNKMNIRLNIRILCVALLVSLALTGLVAPVSAAVNASIIPPSPYSVYTNQTYSLTVGVQYLAAKGGTFQFWIESPPYKSGTAGGQGTGQSGTTALQLVLKAPPTPGTYTLGLKLFVQVQGQAAVLMDTATVTYQVIEPVKTDWDVEKVWIEPSSPGAGDQVTFHATVALRSTTSTKSLSVEVACYLDKKYHSGVSVTFAPVPATQDVAIQKTWTAKEGSHSIIFAVDQNHQHNDPTPYPNYNYKELMFTIEPFYAIVKTITAPPEVKDGGWFDVVATVEYRFPGTTSLEVGHHLWNVTLPPAEPRLDSVTGTGTRDYTFRVQALTDSTAGNCADTWVLQGIVTVRFDRGSGWQTTTPGWEKTYNVTVRRPPYYAVIDAMTAEYLGADSEDSSLGRIRITVDVRYLLPLETGLRLVVYDVANTTKEGAIGGSTEICRDEATIRLEESREGTTTYTYEYTFAISGTTSNMVYFNAVIDYLACGSWNSGDSASTGTSVPYTPPPSSISDYFAAAIQRIADWFRRIFGMD